MKNLNPLIFLLSFAIVLSTACSGGGGGNDSGDSLDTNACGTLGLNTRVINGTECATENSPVVQIVLFNSDGTQGICSGSMITGNDVLTAAHCFLSSNVRSAVVIAGSNTVNATRVFIHPDVSFDTTNQAVFNDVAILTLERTIDTPVLPILVSDSVEADDILSIFGYGFDENKELGALRSGDILVSSVSPNHIFAAYEGEGSNSCNGDSGGPAILSSSVGVGIVGIVSSGTLTSCQVGDVSLYANMQTDTIRDFIKQIVPDVREI